MKLTVIKSDLEKKLSYMKGAVDSRSDRPILGNVALEAKNDFLWLTASDGTYIYAKTKVGSNIKKEGGYTVPLSDLLGIVSKMPKGPIELKLNKTTLSVWGGENWNRKFRISGLPLNQYPQLELDDVEGAEISTKDLQMVYDWSFCASKDKEELQVVFFNFTGDRLEAAATDNLRFSDLTISFDTKASFSFKLPYQSMSYLMKVVGDSLTFNYINGALVVKSNDILVRMPVQIGQFVPYKKFIPESFHSKALVNVKEVQDVLGQVSVHSQSYADSVKLTIENEAVNLFVSSSFGESDVILGAETEGEGSWYLNVPHLQQVLKVIGTPTAEIAVGTVLGRDIIRVRQPKSEQGHFMMAMEKEI